MHQHHLSSVGLCVSVKSEGPSVSVYLFLVLHLYIFYYIIQHDDLKHVSYMIPCLYTFKFITVVLASVKSEFGPQCTSNASRPQLGLGQTMQLNEREAAIWGFRRGLSQNKQTHELDRAHTLLERTTKQAKGTKKGWHEDKGMTQTNTHKEIYEGSNNCNWRRWQTKETSKSYKLRKHIETKTHTNNNRMKHTKRPT